MKRSMAAALCCVALVLSGCSSKFKRYEGPEVTRVLIFKEKRRMYLMHQDAVLRIFDVDLGFAPQGDKKVSGDGRTPEGAYFIDKRNPNSSYHLSVGISYPNEVDRAEALSYGLSPGGDIFIHGEPREFSRSRDWTAGCIAITNDEMEDVYAMVRDGTPIVISP